MFNLELYHVSLYQNSCIEHDILSAKNHSFSNICMPITQEILKMYSHPFRFWFLTNFSVVVLILKALYGSDSEIWGSQDGSVSELNIITAGLSLRPHNMHDENITSTICYSCWNTRRHLISDQCVHVHRPWTPFLNIYKKMQLTHTSVSALIWCLWAMPCTSNGVEYLISSASVDRLIMAGS